MTANREDMIFAFQEAGYTAVPHPSVSGWIAMPLHHQVAAKDVADAHGWVSVPLGWRPNKVEPVKVNKKIINYSIKKD